MSLYDVERRTIVHQTFHIEATSAAEARQIAADIATDAYTEEVEDERITGWTQCHVPLAPTLRVTRRKS